MVKSQQFTKIATFVGETFFVGSLAEFIWQHHYNSQKPEELAHLTVFLPTRRACQALKQALLCCANSNSVILPNITTISDLELLDFLPIHHEFWQHPPRNLIAGLKRIFWVTDYLLKLSTAQPDLLGRLSVSAAMNYAESFLALRDDFLRANVSIADLQDAIMGDYAEHWQHSLDLFIKTMQWLDDKLREHDLYEAIPHQQYIIQTLCDYWAENPHPKPIIAAGSTGSAPATSALLEAIYKLPEGCIILRELDIWLDDDAFDNAPPTHPAYNLKQLLQKLQVKRGDVAQIRAGASNRGELASLLFNPRNKLHEYDLILNDNQSPNIDVNNRINLNGIEWLECQDEAEEIAAITMKIRHALSEGLSEIIVISDDDIFNLRLQTCLHQHNIKVDVSAGIAAHHHPEYNFMLLVARILFEPYNSVNLLSLLRHSSIRSITSPLADYLDNKLVRGLHNINSLQAMLNHLQDKSFEAEIAGGVELLQQIIPQLQQIKQHMSLYEIALLHQTVWQILRGGVDSQFIHASDILQQNMQSGTEYIRLNPIEYIGILQKQCEKQRAISPSLDSHVRIIGALELRLQKADLLIMPRLNAGIFPLLLPSDPWLNRDIRRQLGLNYFERKIGLSAHDMAIMLRFPNVLFSRSRKQGGALKNASPFFERLKLLMRKGNIPPANYLLKWLAQEKPQPNKVIAEPPKILPALHLRPRSLSATACEAAFSNPFKLYVNNICKLNELEPIDDELNAKYFGKALHAALHNASISYNAAAIEPYLEHLERNFAHELAGLMPVEVAQFYHNKLNIILQACIAEEKIRLKEIAKIETESRYQTDFRLNGGTVINLNARIDRIEYLHGGLIRVVDYKTGNPPTNAEIANYNKCQLLVAKLILMSLQNDNNVDQMEYWSLSGKLNNTNIVQPIKGEYDVAEIAEKLRDKLSDLIENPDADYYYNLENNVNYYGKIEHLARI
jgi:ATP-dependent helicase/nuclease subunit B